MMGSGLGFGIPGLGTFLVWGLIILLVVWLVRSIGGAGAESHRFARQILDDRFARGEIDRDEYEDKKALLERRGL